MSILIEKKYNWQHIKDDISECWYVGSRRPVSRMMAYLNNHPDAVMADLKKALNDLCGNFAIIVRTSNRILAAVDKIRSYPIFYYQDAKHFLISNSAQTLKTACNLDEINDLSVLEFLAASYVTGRETLFRDLYQLKAGEFLIWWKQERALERERYFLYNSGEGKEDNENDLIEQLEDIRKKVFRRVVEDAKGVPIWVPLSGGLDSRFVLCSLKQQGYDNLHAFSYGPPHNHEAKTAKTISEKLNIPWHFIPYRNTEICKFFYSRMRSSYWEFSSGLSSLPFMVDEYAIRRLLENLADKDVVIVNGQSGDFTSGGHAYGYHLSLRPDDDLVYEKKVLLDGIIKKHYSLNGRLLTKKNIERVSNKICSVIGLSDCESVDSQEVVRLYELWEWQERQAKYVVNGQRSYDYFGLGWALPLWADEYLIFWSKVTYRLKFQQRLYKSYLDKCDPFNLFREFKPTIWNWQGLSLLAIPVARALRMVYGRKVSEKFYHYASYFGKYSNHFAPFGFAKWVSRAGYIKSPTYFYAETWLEENGIDFESYVQ